MEIGERNAMVLAKCLYYSELHELDMDLMTMPLFDDLTITQQLRWFDKADWIITEAMELIG